MQPVHDILNRIRWDPGFGQDDFEIGFYDRIEKKIVRVAFTDLIFPKDDHFAFELLNSEGEPHHVPYHRVKQIFRNGKLNWHREH